MEKVNVTTRLKEMILVKEMEKAELSKILKKDINLIYHNLNPLNILKNTISGIVNSPDSLKDTIVDSSLGIGAGFLSKKIIVGASHNPMMKLIGYVLQFGISSLVMKHPGVIKSVGSYFFKKVFRKKEAPSEKST